MQHYNLGFLMQRLFAEDTRPWRSIAACRQAEPDLFFPISSSAMNVGQVAAAKEICSGCLVRRECLDFAVQTRQLHGVWGGMTEEERVPVISAAARRQQPAAPVVHAQAG